MVADDRMLKGQLLTLFPFPGFGEPWISGNVNLPQGKVDLKFRIKGDKGTFGPPASPICLLTAFLRRG